MSIKYYVLCGPRYKPPEVSMGSPWLHVILVCMLMQLFVCCDQNKVQFKVQKSVECIAKFRRINQSIDNGNCLLTWYIKHVALAYIWDCFPMT